MKSLKPISQKKLRINDFIQDTAKFTIVGKVDERSSGIQAAEKEKRKVHDLNGEEKPSPAQINMLKGIIEGIIGPLGSIVNLNTAIMQNRYGKANPNIKGASRLATKNGRMLFNILEELMEIADEGESILSGKIDLSPASVSDVLMEIRQTIQPDIEAHELKLETRLGMEKDRVILLDRKKFDFIFKRLCRKAIGFTPAGGQLQILIRESGREGFVEIRLTTTHQEGAKEEVKLNSREARQMVEQTYGVIYSLTQKYVQLVNGEFNVISKDEQGTVFSISLPAIADETSAVATGGLTRMIRKPTRSHQAKKRGVILCHQEEDLHNLKRTLDDTYQVLLARKSADIWSIMEQYEGKVDFILCCGSVPFSHNFQFLRDIAACENCRNIPLLVLTDEIRASFRIKSMDLGVSSYLTYPYESTEFLASIEACLHESSQKSMISAQAGKCKKVPSVSEMDLRWLVELEETIQAEMGNRYFNLSELAYRMATSERQLFRKVKLLTGKTPNKYLRDLRIYAARKLLLNYTYKTVAEISYAVGFQDPHYFSKIFKSTFGKWPSDYLLKSSYNQA